MTTSLPLWSRSSSVKGLPPGPLWTERNPSPFGSRPITCPAPTQASNLVLPPMTIGTSILRPAVQETAAPTGRDGASTLGLVPARHAQTLAEAFDQQPASRFIVPSGSWAWLSASRPFQFALAVPVAPSTSTVAKWVPPRPLPAWKLPPGWRRIGHGPSR